MGTAPHGIQFFQRNGFYLEAHTTYSISFKAKADVVRDIRVIMENPSENFRNLSLHTVELGTDWTTYELVIHNGFTTTADAKIGFFLGLIDADAPERSAATKVYFDDVEVKLIGYAVDEVAPMIWVADAEVEQDAVFNPLTGVKYGDFAKAPQLVITSETAGLVTFNEGVYTIDTSTVGNFIFTYTVTDIYGNVTVFDRALNIVEPVIE
ncbi:MAG: carbohydrate binding domain-containing protein [Acholeplasmataceae bacterium]|nr:carbohydrate binding domain-containing protein [Acholeplasmataceae bacterium]